MVCPFCGSATSGSGACATCGRTPGLPAVGVGALTPPPPYTPTGATVTDIRSPGHAAWVTEGPLAPGQAFGSRYRILKLLGAGGMGVVYQAWDQALDLPVALKVIRPEVVADASLAREVEGRFKRELVLARQVTHRNVVRIHDLGEIDGIKYISMPFIEGKTLSSVIAENGRVPYAMALGIVRQIADGLQAAHDAGVVHRDLKPDNVMMDADGRVVIMDFGISRPVEAGTTLGLTAAGAVIGTVQYMAPEQAMGEPVDGRSDLYALGLIAYDLISGSQRLSTVTTPVSEMMHRVQHAPAPLRTKVPDAPAEIERILARALEPDPTKRYQRVSEFIADLDAFTQGGARSWIHHVLRTRWAQAGIAAGILILAAVIGILATRWRPAPAPPVAREPVSVLIADFENRAKESLFDGVLEQALAIGIEGAAFIGAYPRTEALRISRQLAPGQPLDVDRSLAVARREGIKILLAGAVEAGNPGYRLSVRVIDPMPNREIAQVEANAVTKSDVLHKIGTLASDLRSRLGDTTPETARLAAAETFTASSLEAARDFSLAQVLASAGKDEEAVDHYKAAIAREPNFARAHAALGVSAWKLGRTEESAEAYRKAFSLMDRMTDREKYRTLGTYYLTITRNYEKAVENYTELVKLYPADRAGHSNLALAYFFVLNFPKALEEGRAAVALYPKNVTFRNNVALYAMYAGDFATATTEAKRVIEQDSTFHKAYLPLAMAALAKEDEAAAKQAYAGMAKTGSRGQSLAVSGLADLAAVQGRFAEAEGLLKDGIAADERTKATAALAAKYVALAEAYQGWGKSALALQAGRSALKLIMDESTAYPVARIALAAGREREAAEVSAALVEQLQPKPRAYGKLIEGEIALRSRREADAVQAFRDAQKLADVWAVRFQLGVAYVTAGSFAEGLAELDACVRRQGEATALFLDEVPTFRYIVPLHYWRGRAQEGLGLKAQADESYKTFLALRSAAATDPLVVDARRRLSAQGITGN